MSATSLPVAVIGAGPVGLAAAAHLLERGETPLVLEAGDGAGFAVRQWRHVRMFSPWAFNTDKAAVAMLERSGWRHPAGDDIPTGGDFVARYLEPLAALPALRSRVAYRTRVVAVGRKGYDKVKTAGRTAQPFLIRATNGDGRTKEYETKAVIDASGTLTSPNPLGAGGLPAIGEAELGEAIVYGIPDIVGTQRRRYADRTTLIVGSGHSALNALLDLAALRETAPRTAIIWALRRADVESAFGGGAADQLAARGELGERARHLVDQGGITVLAPFQAARIERRGNRLSVAGTASEGAEASVETDEIIVATGFRPELSFLREIRLSIDPWLESAGTIGPLIDPNLHSCGTVRPHGYKELSHPEESFFIAGMKSYGRAPTFLAATGYEQVRSIAAALAGDFAAAARVELELPETGVCSTAPPSAKPAAPTACCPAPATAETAGACKPAAPATAPPRAAASCCSRT